MRETAIAGLNVALPSAPLGPRSSDRIHGIYRGQRVEKRREKERVGGKRERTESGKEEGEGEGEGEGGVGGGGKRERKREMF